MAQIRDYRKLAHDIICEVGGKENIVNATRCATRLRLVLKEEPEQAKEKVAAMAGVITVVENSGQFSIISDLCHLVLLLVVQSPLRASTLFF